MIKPKGRADAEKYYLKYERVPLFCFYCGCMGHTERDCLAEVKALPGIRFGLDLRASPHKKFEHRRWTITADPAHSAARNLNFGINRRASSSASVAPRKE